MADLGGKVAIVTGASAGIGEATARAFAASGVRVAAAGARPLGRGGGAGDRPVRPAAARGGLSLPAVALLAVMAALAPGLVDRVVRRALR